MRPTLKGTLIAASTTAAVAGVLIANPAGPLANAPVAPEEPSASPSAAETPSATPSAGAEAVAPTDGTYTGDAVQTRYGPMQVEATVSGGAITDITWLQMPGDRHSQQINSYAAPALVEEALAAQSATVSTISGATYTSEGFRKSLQSILDQAGLS